MRADPPRHREPSRVPPGEIAVVESPEHLPFVGREEELDYLVAFTRGALSADRLSALWLQGEAGIGKSRIIDRLGVTLFPAVILIRVTLYPDAHFSLNSALTAAVLEAAQIYGISTHLSASASLPATLAELRGVIRRYPTLIVFEDLHLVDQSIVGEFAGILHGLERESVGLIGSSRPNGGPAYGIVLPFLVTTLSLNPLGVESIHRLVEHFGYRPERYPNLIRLIMERTHGSPLAIWSLFRRIQSNPEALTQQPLRTVREIAAELSDSILESMGHGLSAEEMAAAERLSLLGEVFSSRAAAILLDGDLEILSQLQGAGIISPQSGSPLPLVGTVSVDRPDQDWLYRFSHSLLHEALVARAPEPDGRLLRLLESDIPLYSTLPFMQGAASQDLIGDREALERLLWRYRRIIRELGSSPAWNAGVRVFRAVEGLLDRHRSLLTSEEYRAHHIEMLLLECALFNAFSTRPEFQRPLEQTLNLTGDPANLQEGLWRIRALQFSLFRQTTSWQIRGEGALAEVRELLREYPELLHQEETRSLFANLASTVRTSGDSGEVEYVREMIDRMLLEARERGDRRGERSVLREVAPQIIPLFRNREEIEDRRRLASEIIESFGNEKLSGRILTTWVRFLEATGEADQAHGALQKWMPPVLSGYNLGTEVGLRLQKLNVDAALGMPLEQIGRRARTLISEFEYIQPTTEGDTTPSFAQIATATHLITIGAMRGDVAEGYRLAVEICGGEEEAIRGYRELDRAALGGDLETLRRLAEQNIPSETFAETLAWLRSASAKTEQEARTALRNTLLTPVLRRHDLLRTRIAVALYELLGEESERMEEEDEELIRQGYRLGLEWLGQRYAPGYAETMAQDAGKYLRVDDIVDLLGERYATLLSAAEEEEKARTEPEQEEAAPLKLLQRNTSERADLRIFLLGTIAMQKKGEARRGLRGARMKRFLAMLGIQEMLSSDLTLQEFRESATELDDPEESANYLRILTSRLRKSIGNQMILTDGESPPRLNTDLVRLDLVDIAGQIETAARATAQNNGAAACALLNEVIEEICDQEIVPGQEGEFFDAARREFDDRLRNAVHRTVELLKREGSEMLAEELSAKFRECFGTNGGNGE